MKIKKQIAIATLLLTISIQPCFSMDNRSIDFNYSKPIKKTYVRVIRTSTQELPENKVSMKLKLVNTECIHDIGYVQKEQYSSKRLTSYVFTENPNGEIAIFNIPKDAIIGDINQHL